MPILRPYKFSSAIMTITRVNVVNFDIVMSQLSDAIVRPPARPHWVSIVTHTRQGGWDRQ